MKGGGNVGVNLIIPQGVFKELRQRPDYKANAAQLAVTLDCDLNAMIRILNALSSIGLLSSQRDTFMLTDITLSHLVRTLILNNELANMGLRSRACQDM